MADFNINLVKSMTSSPEARVRFYNRMLIYLVTCAALLVGVSYLSARNVVAALRANGDRETLIREEAAVMEFGQDFHDNPEQSLKEFTAYAADLDILRSALEQRSQFLPVLSRLFSDFPEDIVLEDLKANAADKSIEFLLVAPVIDEEGNEVLRALQNKWRDDEELRARANAVTQVSNEREMVGDILMSYAEFKCIVK